MASTARGTTASLEEDLLRQGHRYSFFQAMHLLQLLSQDAGEGRGDSRVRVRPVLSLAFPSADVARVVRTAHGFLVDATFIGLYGPASPLPTFYTEELIEEAAADGCACRDLLDIINHRLLTLFHQCLIKYRVFYQVAQQGRGEYLDRLFCLVGLSDHTLRRDIPAPATLLRYLGLLGLHGRSALALSTMLADALEVPVKVIQCQERRVSVPRDQELRVGVGNCSLGMDAVIGCEVKDRSGKFRVCLGPLGRESFTNYLPGTTGRRDLDLLVGVFVPAPLEWDVQLVHRAEDVPCAKLGTLAGCRLGWDSWMAPGEALREPSVIFPANPGQPAAHTR